MHTSKQKIVLDYARIIKAKTKEIIEMTGTTTRHKISAEMSTTEDKETKVFVHEEFIALDCDIKLLDRGLSTILAICNGLSVVKAMIASV